MRRYSLLLAVACAGIVGREAKAEDPFPSDLAAQQGAVRLLPAAPWNVDFGETKCRLSRTFGSGLDRHILFIDQIAPTPQFGLTVAGPEFAPLQKSKRISLGMRRDQPMIQFGPAGRATVGDYGPGLVFSLSLRERVGWKDKQEPKTELEFAGIDLQDAEQSERLVIASGKRVITFETGSMSEPIHALNVCTRDLLVQWGLDPELHERYIPPKWINMISIAKRLKQFYPPSALRAGESGIFNVRVIVEADGSISECHLENLTVTETLRSPACKEMHEAQFEPARDAEGQPMRSFLTTSITYATN